jgi:uncharacterized phage protein (TIGR02218 family)
MKQVSEGLRAHLAGELTTIAELVKITRTDGRVIAMTSHDRDLTLDDVTYRAEDAFSSTGKMAQATVLKTKDFDIAGVLSSSQIDESDIRAGLYDHARIDFALCNWADLSQGMLHLRRGWLGEVAVSGGLYIAALRGFQDLLTRKVGETYTPECRYEFCDGRCGLNAASYTVTGQVSSVTDRQIFYDSARSEEEGWFNDGQLTWLSGANEGAMVEVQRWESEPQRLTLWLPMSAAIQVGDTYSLLAGCDKRFATCRTRFGNDVNYGGFPHLPGIGRLLDYPG